MPVSRHWPAPAKINVFLHITGRRADGYHLLETLFQFVDVCDDLAFAVREDGQIRRLSAVPGLAEQDDLVVRAAQALQRHSGTALGADIELEKRLPMGGGLGGGSSDAATVLVALNVLWKLNLGLDELARLGLALGADVPVFVRGQCAWAQGVGELLQPFELDESPLLVITPNCAVSTAQVFNDADLTRDTPPIKMHAFSLAGSHNDCEPVTRRLYPEVGKALDWLAQFAPPRMSGTGASVFAFFDTSAEAAVVAARVPEQWSQFIGNRVNRSPLLDRLAQAQAEI